MSLPGKLCIGILEEDNPLKSYFRFKPLLVESDGQFIPYADSQAYPAEGCIRIVPDKNESHHFKARMRRIGLFCVVDLRAYPENNDKIRPNKNYREDGPEHNAFIIYSDVVREPAPDTIFELVPDADPQSPVAAPRTTSVLMAGESIKPEIYRWEPLPDDGDRARLLPAERACAVERLQRFALPAFGAEELSFAILPPADLERRPDTSAPKPPQAAPEERPEPLGEPKPASEPVPAPEIPEGRSEGEKPWLHRDDGLRPSPVDPRLSPAQRSLAAQSGLNPRRGRSLQELIDEKWQQSRLNQLGQNVASIHTGAPVTSPVDSAVSAVREVWNQPQLRRDLLESLGGIEEFGASLEECREAARQSDIERHLEGLEARRLALLAELDRLNLKNAEIRDALKQELLREASGELAEAVRRAGDARAEQARYEQLAEESRAAARDARKAVEQLTGEALEQQLAQFALNEHMVERMRQLKGEAEALPPAAPGLQTVDLNTLAVRVMNRFDASGFAITRLEALDLCVCAALSPVLILSGPVGSGKTETVRLLAEALGWSAAGRFAVFSPAASTLENDPRVADLDKLPEVPALLLLDDANLHAPDDPLRGLEFRLRPSWRLALTVQDGGAPLSAHALDRGFTLRLNPKPGAPWRPHSRTACPPEAPAALDFCVPDAPLPAALEARMDALREHLARRGAQLSRRALDESWRYCALMLAALGKGADPMAVLDRAVAQRLLPSLLAAAPMEALAALPSLLEDLPRSRALLGQPLPIQL